MAHASAAPNSNMPGQPGSWRRSAWQLVPVAPGTVRVRSPDGRTSPSPGRDRPPASAIPSHLLAAPASARYLPSLPPVCGPVLEELRLRCGKRAGEGEVTDSYYIGWKKFSQAMLQDWIACLIGLLTRRTAAFRWWIPRPIEARLGTARQAVANSSEPVRRRGLRREDVGLRRCTDEPLRIDETDGVERIRPSTIADDRSPAKRIGSDSRTRAARVQPRWASASVKPRA